MILQFITIAILILGINHFDAKLDRIQDKIKAKEVRIIESRIPILPDTIIHPIPYFKPNIVPVDTQIYKYPWGKTMERQDTIRTGCIADSTKDIWKYKYETQSKDFLLLGE